MTLYPCKKSYQIVRNPLHGTSAAMLVLPSDRGMTTTVTERGHALRATCHDPKCMCCKNPQSGDIYKLYNTPNEGELLFIH